MSIAKILAPVTGGQRDASVLANAIEAARPFNAHVMAFFVRPDLSEALAFFTDGVSGVVVDEVVKATKDAGDDAERRIQATISTLCAANGVERVERPVRAGKVKILAVLEGKRHADMPALEADVREEVDDLGDRLLGRFRRQHGGRLRGRRLRLREACAEQRRHERRPAGGSVGSHGGSRTTRQRHRMFQPVIANTGIS